MFKVAESIYSTRCPNELPDFITDEPQLSISVKKSNSLRQHMSSTAFFGWTKVDVIITAPNTIIERWILVHRPNNRNSSEKINGDAKKAIYRNFSSSLRAVFSMMNALPATALQNYLDKIPSCIRRISIVCDHFHPLPASFSSSEIKSAKQIHIASVITPLGKTDVVCHYSSNAMLELPKISTVIYGSPSSSSSESSKHDEIQFNMGEQSSGDKTLHFDNINSMSIGSFVPSFDTILE